MGRKIAAGLGLAEFPFDTVSGFWRFVDLCESGGADSLWQTDRILSRTPILESMITVAAIAGRTRRLKFGINVLSLAFREPVLAAKQCATIDVLSEGRLLPGFGIGSPVAPEWDSMEIDTRTRGARTNEALMVIRRLWKEDEVDFAGKFFHLRHASISPRPAQAELPMWIGGSSEAAIRRTARFGTGWQAGPETPAQAAEAIRRLKAGLAETGRTIDEDHYGAGIQFRFGNATDPAVQHAFAAYRQRTGREPEPYFAIGDSATILHRISQYVRAGISKFILRPIANGDDDVNTQARCAIEQVLPRLGAIRIDE